MRPSPEGHPVPPAGPGHGPGCGSEPAGAVARLQEEDAALRTRAAQLAEDMAALIAASLDSNADDEHDPEGQTIAFERSQLSAVTARTHEHLREVEAALGRVRAGTYGVCEVCHRPIDAARLKARPTARACVDHVSALRDAP